MKQILVKGAFLVLAAALLTTPWQPAYGAGGRMAGKVTDPKGAIVVGATTRQPAAPRRAAICALDDVLALSVQNSK